MNEKTNDFYMGYLIGKADSAQMQAKLFRKCRSANVLAFCAISFCAVVYMNLKDQELRVRKIRREIEDLKGE